MNETKPANMSRHEVAKRLKAIKTQIGIATKYFKKEQKNIDNLYSKVSTLIQERSYLSRIHPISHIDTCFSQTNSHIYV